MYHAYYTRSPCRCRYLSYFLFRGSIAFDIDYSLPLFKTKSLCVSQIIPLVDTMSLSLSVKQLPINYMVSTAKLPEFGFMLCWKFVIIGDSLNQIKDRALLKGKNIALTALKYHGKEQPMCCIPFAWCLSVHGDRKSVV